MFSKLSKRLHDLKLVDSRVFRQQYDSPFSFDEDGDERGGPFDFVPAAMRAAREQDRVSFDQVVDEAELWRYKPTLLDSWLWGPHGEFTNFGKVRAFSILIDRRAASLGDITFDFHLQEAPHIQFRVTPLRIDPAGDRFASTFVKFATYADYVAWEALAMRDIRFNRLTRDKL